MAPFVPFYQAERLIYEQAQQNPFNKGRFLKEPWGLICNVIVNQPLEPKLIYLVAILHVVEVESTRGTQTLFCGAWLR